MSLTVGNPFSSLQNEIDSSDEDSGQDRSAVPTKPVPKTTVDAPVTASGSRGAPAARTTARAPAATQVAAPKPRQQQQRYGDNEGGSHHPQSPSDSRRGGRGRPESAQWHSRDSDEERGQTRRGRGAPMGERARGRGGAPRRGGHREFDHHVSGTGRQERNKRQGGGAHNWGANDMNPGQADQSGEFGYGTDRADALLNSDSMEQGGGRDGWDVFQRNQNTGDTYQSGADADRYDSRKPQDDGAADERNAPVEEAETITVDEYRRRQAAKRANLPSLPNTGTDISALTAAQRTELERDGFQPQFKGHEGRGEHASSFQRDFPERPMKTKEHAALETEQAILDGSRNRGRGGMRDRGGRNRITPAGETSTRVLDIPAELRKIDLKDNDAFPTL